MEAIRVALRCRPLVPKEEQDGCSECLEFVGDNQVVLGHNKAFTYDYVFGSKTPQADVYDMAVTRLVSSFFKGYNTTVLAYGQTGSGKTHTMGSACNFEDEEEMGVIPRVARCIFETIEKSEEHNFKLRVSFLEIYKEDLMDLLVPVSQRDKDTVSIREANNGGIMLQGLTERQVGSCLEMMNCLSEGSHGRTVGATAMNSTSSRSHAIFTVHMERTAKADSQDTFTAKFHLVDLAGSERAKKTGAEGNRFKEGVNINKGLLALGNVISALGDETHKRSHIPYRDSKLTRLLQDSLGGNSQTLMVACVSPADSNMEETMSTLRYADRARKIKNKPIVNRDPQAAEILRLKQQVQDLQVLLAQCGGGNFPLPTSSAPIAANSEEVQSLRDRISKLESQEDKLLERLHTVVNDNATNLERSITMEMAYENLKQKVERWKERTGLNLSRLDNTTFVKETGTNTSTETADSAESEPQSAPHAVKHPWELLQDLHHEMTQIGVLDDDSDFLSTIREETEPSCNFPAAEESLDSDEEDEEEEGTPKRSETSGGADTISTTEKTARKTATLSRNLSKLNTVLAEKQELCYKMKQGSEELRIKYEKEIKSLEENLNKLQQERDELNSALTSAKTTAVASKLSEQRRKRIQDLEEQMNELKRKMKEQAKSLKVKDQQDLQVNKLNTEIMAMKQQRVKMYKQLKEDNANFIKWKQAKDKELMQMKAKERKHKAELAKMERMNEKQHTVLRRKAEEAAAANRRLKEALGRQKLTAEDRKRRVDTAATSNNAARLRKFLTDELEVLVSVNEAKRHKQALIEDRKSLTQQLKELRMKLDEDPPPPAKKQLLNDSSSRSAEEDTEAGKRREELSQLERCLQLTSAQINDLQQKIIDADLDDKNKSRFTSIHSVVEAKCGLRFLLEKSSEAMSSNAQLESKLTDTIKQNKERLETVQEEMANLKRSMKEMKRQQKMQVAEQVSQLPASASSSSSSTDHTPVANGNLKEELKAKSEECVRLKKELTLAYFKQGRKGPLMPDIDDCSEPVEKAATNDPPAPRFFSHAFVGPSVTDMCDDAFGPSRGKRSGTENIVYNNTFIDDESDAEAGDEMEEQDDDDDKDWGRDPLWAPGLTPGIVATTRTKSRTEYKKEEKPRCSSTVAEKPVDGVMCGCNSNCGSRRCKCVKSGNKCGDACKCNSDMCINGEVCLPESTTDDYLQTTQESVTSGLSTLNETFVKDNSAEASLSPDSSSVLQTSNTGLAINRKRSSGARAIGRENSGPSTEVTVTKKRKILPSK